MRSRVLPTMLTAALLAFAGVAAGCGDDEESPASEQAGGGPPAQTQEGGQAEQLPTEVTVEEILDNPQRFYGEQVTVSGAVAQIVVQPGAFTLGASTAGGGQEGLGDEQQGLGDEGTQGAILVLPTSQVRFPQAELTESDVVQVQGTVQRVTANIAQENPDDEFLFQDDQFLTQFQNRPGIVASAIDVATDQPGGGGQRGGAQSPGGGQTQTTP